MPRTNASTNGNGQKPDTASQQSINSQMPDPFMTTNPADFQLNADATIAQFLNASDDQYYKLLHKLQQERQIKIAQRAREIANLLNPHLQMEEVMVQAQTIVNTETAGMPPTGHTLPNIRRLTGLR